MFYLDVRKEREMPLFGVERRHRAEEMRHKASLLVRKCVIPDPPLALG